MWTKRFECPFSLWGRRAAESRALCSEEGALSYRECNQRIEGIAATLKERGVSPGSCIALFPTSTLLSPLLFFALFRIGAIALPIPCRDPLTTLPHKMERAKAALLIHPDTLSPPLPQERCLPFSQLMEQQGRGEIHFLEKEAHATYLFTSGTSGAPKIACHSLANHYYSALGSCLYLQLQRGDCYALTLPLYHVSGIAILFRTFLAGACLSLRQEEARATHLSLVPTQLERMVERALPFKGKQILLGGAPLPHSLIERARAVGLPIQPTYGMTEMSAQITGTTAPLSFSLGHPLPYRELKLARDGEILVRGKTLFQGYLRADGTLHLPLTEEGYFATRDVGSYCSKRGLYVKGRKDRLFISGGENIHPEEIEAALLALEGVEEARVEGKFDAAFGKRPIAYIKSDQPLNHERLRRLLSVSLPPFKIPLSFFPFRGSQERR